MQLEFIQEVLKLAGLSFVRTINFPGKYPVYEYSISSFGRLEDHPSNKKLLVIVTPDWFSRLKMRFLSGMVYLNLEYFGEVILGLSFSIVIKWILIIRKNSCIYLKNK